MRTRLCVRVREAHEDATVGEATVLTALAELELAGGSRRSPGPGNQSMPRPPSGVMPPEPSSIRVEAARADAASRSRRGTPACCRAAPARSWPRRWSTDRRRRGTPSAPSPSPCRRPATSSVTVERGPWPRRLRPSASTIGRGAVDAEHEPLGGLDVLGARRVGEVLDHVLARGVDRERTLVRAERRRRRRGTETLSTRAQRAVVGRELDLSGPSVYPAQLAVGLAAGRPVVLRRRRGSEQSTRNQSNAA